jgi:GTP diphosphokinase / guanosine-3',5'-bis(diphosphate) 3'-diphosphatase
MVHQPAQKASSPFSWAEFQSHIRYLPTAAQTRIQHAFDLGMEAHEGQTRKSGEPYFSHSIAVAHILADWGADADTVIAAFLHDALEDTDLSEDEIREEFGSDVLLMVEALTKLEAEDVAEKPTLDEQIESIRKLFTYMQEDVRIMVVKLADRLHNMQTVQFLPEQKQRILAKETLDVYVKIADRLCMRDVRDELAELALSVLEPDILEKLLVLRSEGEQGAEEIIGRMKKALRMVPGGATIEAHYEPHRFRRLRKQLEIGSSAASGVTALTVIFTCEDIATCYQMLGALHQCWPRESMSFEDFINAPQINGYRGLHTTVILDDGVRIRCKIRTRDMQAYARRGVTMACFDGKPIGLPSYLEWGGRISPLSQDTTDRSEEFFESLQSDILGDSITIYGPDGESQLLPDGSTALDAAFYFLGDKAWRLKALRVDGKEAQFQMPLKKAVTLECELTRERTVSRQWLSFVKTGLAVARIRSALTQIPHGEKSRIGAELLQSEFDKYKMGDMFHLVVQNNVLFRTLGVHSVEAVFVQIAEGSLSPSRIIGMLASQKAHSLSDDGLIRRQAGHRRNLLIKLQGRYREGQNIYDLVRELCKKNGIQCTKLTVTWSSSERYTANINVCSGSPEALDRFCEELRGYSDVAKIKTALPRLLLLQFATTALLVTLAWLVFLISFVFLIRENWPWFAVYGSILPALGANILAYRVVSNYYPRVRRSRAFVFSTFAANCLAVILYSLAIFMRQLDVLQLSLFLPLSIIILFGVALFPLFLRRESWLAGEQVENKSAQGIEVASSKQKVAGYVLRLTAVMIWGIEPLYIRYTEVNVLSPMLRTFLLSIGAIVSFGPFWIMKKHCTQVGKQQSRLPLDRFFLYLIIGQAGLMYLKNACLIYTTATNFLLFNNFSPIIGLLVASFLWRKDIPYLRNEKNMVIILLLAAASGIGSILLLVNSFAGVSGRIVGDILAVLAVFFDVLITISIIEYLRRHLTTDGLLLNLHIFFYLLLITAPVVGTLSMLGFPIFYGLTWKTLILAMGIGVLVGMGQFLSYEAFRRIDGYIAFMMFNLSVLVAMVFEVFVINTVLPTQLLLLSAILIVCSSSAAEVINSRCRGKVRRLQKVL